MAKSSPVLRTLFSQAILSSKAPPPLSPPSDQFSAISLSLAISTTGHINLVLCFHATEPTSLTVS